uniref:Uncharacterized protein n=1 Tax=Vibrio phage Vc1 TaxID=1480731 RepID=A0A6M5CCX0_9CAUD
MNFVQHPRDNLKEKVDGIPAQIEEAVKKRKLMRKNLRRSLLLLVKLELKPMDLMRKVLRSHLSRKRLVKTTNNFVQHPRDNLKEKVDGIPAQIEEAVKKRKLMRKNLRRSLLLLVKLELKPMDLMRKVLRSHLSRKRLVKTTNNFVQHPRDNLKEKVDGIPAQIEEAVKKRKLMRKNLRRSLLLLVKLELKPMDLMRKVLRSHLSRKRLVKTTNNFVQHPRDNLKEKVDGIPAQIEEAVKKRKLMRKNLRRSLLLLVKLELKPMDLMRKVLRSHLSRKRLVKTTNNFVQHPRDNLKEKVDGIPAQIEEAVKKRKLMRKNLRRSLLLLVKLELKPMDLMRKVLRSHLSRKRLVKTTN